MELINLHKLSFTAIWNICTYSGKIMSSIDALQLLNIQYKKYKVEYQGFFDLRFRTFNNVNNSTMYR